MEPIELSGKTFCSNCGLTVGNSSPKDPIAQITNPFTAKSVSPSGVGEPIQQSTSNSAVSTTPIKDEAEEQLGISNKSDIENPVQPVLGAIIESPSGLGAVKIKATEGLNTSETSVETSYARERSTETDDKAETNETGLYTASSIDVEDSEENNSPELLDDQEQTIQDMDVSEMKPEEIPPLGQNIDIPTESDFDVPSSQNEVAPINLNEKIKEVDTLGASGILLDILNENYRVSEREENLHALEAAEELVDKVQLADEDELATKHNSDILKDQPQNPVEFPEIASPLSELEIEAPTDNSSTMAEVAEVPSSSSVTEKNNDVNLDDLYKLPHELENLPNPHTPEETNNEIAKVEHELTDITDPPIDESIEDSAYYDPDTIEPLDLPIKPIDPDKSIQKQEEKQENSSDSSSLKHEAVKNFFKERVEKPKKSSFSWLKFKATDKPKRKSQKTKKPKKTVTQKVTQLDDPQKPIKQNKKTKRNKKWLLYLLLIILTTTLGLTSFFAYKNYYLPTKQQGRTTETATTLEFESKTPNEVPAGYEMTGSNFDENSKELVIRYALVNDTNKTLVYRQTVLDSAPTEDIDRYVKTKDGTAFITKEQNNISFTEFTDGTLVWTSDNFLFTIETQGYDLSRDLIYKMALSIG